MTVETYLNDGRVLFLLLAGPWIAILVRFLHRMAGHLIDLATEENRDAGTLEKLVLSLCIVLAPSLIFLNLAADDPNLDSRRLFLLGVVAGVWIWGMMKTLLRLLRALATLRAQRARSTGGAWIRSLGSAFFYLTTFATLGFLLQSTALMVSSQLLDSSLR